MKVFGKNMEIYKKEEILYLKTIPELYCVLMPDHTRSDIKPWKPMYEIGGNYILRYAKFKRIPNQMLGFPLDSEFLHYENTKYWLLRKITNLPEYNDFMQIPNVYLQK